MMDHSNKREIFGAIKRLNKKNHLRLFVYILLAIVCITSVAIAINIRRQTEKNIAKQELGIRSIAAWQALEKRKTDYQTLGLDVSKVEDKLSKVYQAIYSTEDYVLVDSLIVEANSQLDELYARYLADKKQKIEEALKGDISGKISCSGKECQATINLSLSTSSDTLAAIQTDQSGNYTFHINANNYNLTATASGYKSGVKTNISIISQKQITVDLDLEKIVVNPKKSTGSSGSTGSSESSGSPTTSESNSPVNQLVNLINNYRQENGLSKLILDPLLNIAAENHSSWMQSSGGFSHIGENDSTPWDRCQSAGTTCFGEIIYRGSSGPNAAFLSWKNSPPHNAIMLGSSFSSMGIGIAGNYYTVDFR